MSERLSPDVRRKVLFLALGFYLVFCVTNVSYFLPVYYDRVGVSHRDAGWLVAVFYIVSVISRPFLGGLVTVIGFRRFFLIAGALSIACASGVAYFAGNFWPALASRALLGLGNGMFQVGLATYQAVAFNERERGLAFSLTMAGGLAPMMTIFPAADWLLLRGFTGLYILIPLLFCVAAAILAPLIPGIGEVDFSEDGVPQSANPFTGLRDCLAIPPFRLAIFAMFLFCIIDAGSAFMSMMTVSFGLMASLFLSSSAIVGVCVRLFCGRLLDRFPRWLLSTPTILLTTGAMLLATINPSEKSLVILGLVFGVGMGLGFPLHLALVSDSVPKHLQPHAVSISWFLLGLDFAVIPLIMGWLGEWVGPVWAFRSVTLTALAGGAISFKMYRSAR